MTNNEKSKILEWLFVNDHNAQSSRDWREKFIKMLEGLIMEDAPKEKCENTAGPTKLNNPNIFNYNVGPIIPKGYSWTIEEHKKGEDIDLSKIVLYLDDEQNKYPLNTFHGTNLVELTAILSSSLTSLLEGIESQLKEREVYHNKDSEEFESAYAYNSAIREVKEILNKFK